MIDGARAGSGSVVRDVDALEGAFGRHRRPPGDAAADVGADEEFVARQHTKLAPYKPHAPGASSSFHDALSPGGADPLKERADDLLRAMV